MEVTASEMSEHRANGKGDTSSVIRLAGDAGCHLPLQGKAKAPRNLPPAAFRFAKVLTGKAKVRFSASAFSLQNSVGVDPQIDPHRKSDFKVIPGSLEIKPPCKRTT